MKSALPADLGPLVMRALANGRRCSVAGLALLFADGFDRIPVEAVPRIRAWLFDHPELVTCVDGDQWTLRPTWKHEAPPAAPIAEPPPPQRSPFVRHLSRSPDEIIAAVRACGPFPTLAQVAEQLHVSVHRASAILLGARCVEWVKTGRPKRIAIVGDPTPYIEPLVTYLFRQPKRTASYNDIAGAFGVSKFRAISMAKRCQRLGLVILLRTGSGPGSFSQVTAIAPSSVPT